MCVSEAMPPNRSGFAGYIISANDYPVKQTAKIGALLAIFVFRDRCAALPGSRGNVKSARPPQGTGRLRPVRHMSRDRNSSRYCSVRKSTRAAARAMSASV